MLHKKQITNIISDNKTEVEEDGGRPAHHIRIWSSHILLTPTTFHDWTGQQIWGNCNGNLSITLALNVHSTLKSWADAHYYPSYPSSKAGQPHSSKPLSFSGFLLFVHAWVALRWGGRWWRCIEFLTIYICKVVDHYEDNTVKDG